ncbi:MAG TPA: G1 family glutamic endopeptidase, partial [Acidimicrobiales bacterium]|nr:G1 family glutamic endopeptidase [Acidimicrobiales bacterium]
WTVPTAQPSRPHEYSATWVGVDGVNNSSLIQVGTDQNSGSGTTTYDAWYEILPAPAQVQPEPVAPGDVMQAQVTEQSPGTWQIVIQDVTANWSASGSFAYSGPGSSAEWIEEAPTVGGSQSTIANFGTMQFTNMAITSPDTGSSGLTPVSLEQSNGVVISYPGVFDASTQSFPITYGTPVPVISSVSPSQGSTGGGTSVTINGDYLTGASSVSFGGTSVPFTTNADNSLSVTAPARSAGTVNVSVTTPGGTSSSSANDQFTYVGSSPTTTEPPTTEPPTSQPPSSPPSSQSQSSPSGYDMVGQDGGVFVFPIGQSGGFYGSLPGLGVHVKDIVGMVPSPDDKGYFLVGQDGGVFAFGDAPYLGSLPGLGLRVQDIRGIVPTSDNRGYFLVGQDGGVFAFGDAPFVGSLPGEGIHISDVIGIAATPSDQGYWVVAGNGTVYAFGNAHNFGSATGTPSPVSGIASTPDGGGYWIVTQSGGVYTFGDAGNYSSLPALGVTPTRPIIGLVPTSDEHGYWLIGGDGGIFAFGDAPFVGSLPGLGIHITDVVGAVPTSL